MLDDTLLDDPAALRRADRDRALLALAGSGARVRTALRLAEAAGLDRLRPDGRPRAVLVAGHGSALTAGEMLAALAGPASLVAPLPPTDAAPVPRTDRASAPPVFTAGLAWQLPGWAGPLDLLVISSAAGGERGLVALAEQAYARGCAIVVTAPGGSPLAEAALQVRALPLPFVPSADTSDAPDDDGERGRGGEPDLPAEDPAALWAHLAPLLALTQKLGVTPLPYDALAATADLLDATAVRCRPDAAAYTNPAKSLAARLAGTVPLLWAEGPVAGAAAGRFAAQLAERAGRPALAGLLPQALTAHRGMFTGQLGAGADPDDFFRDRVDEPDPLHLQVLLLRQTVEEAPAGAGSAGPGLGGAPGEDDGGPVEVPADDARPRSYGVTRAHRLAAAHDVRLTEYAGRRAEPLHALVELVALTDFAAVYLGLAAQS
ncbi:SIS domain-containing protein [Kitasatospora purpeofusca]|uniref:SIS domain-containing protein n=1 Tax=Kitasatospora purpeofusca TaxID=67352 RepID=UPI002253E4B4|nr:SIS domain-containing protein [Kitasatospora purpeofusca]MCX4753084.1 mannose-6-phosphate isomerase [Kitasatospora purpeofusca]WSR32614.1 mannose-6-phosphate isomerase [Kitasatospora purpeofusca]WSR40704.1 mannose-6-phosphate isomerase [Kitasatospora purpeofusca]